MAGRRERHLVRYFIAHLHKKTFLAVLLISLASGGLVFLTPLVTTRIVDQGVQLKDLRLVIYLLAAQLAIYIGTTVADVFRNWLVLHMNKQFSISVLRDFLLKLSALPISFFDKKPAGDLQQRINDHSRIQLFLTTYLLSFMVSIVTFCAYFTSLAYFNYRILYVLLVFNAGSVLWMMYFQKSRKQIDQDKFYKSGVNQDNILEIISGMQEIKLNNASEQKISKWHRTQLELATINSNALRLDQKQTIGSALIGQIENVIISLISAYDVIHGNMTLGMMVTIGLITGQLKGVLNVFLFFIRYYQDASISVNRLMDIHKRKNEDDTGKMAEQKLRDVAIGDIVIEGVSFAYSGCQTPVLEQISLRIEKGKTLAIVGTSGSGKTTLLKMLLKFYAPVSGRIKINPWNDLEEVSADWWRDHCAVIMQDGFIFTDTIAENIAMTAGAPNQERLVFAASLANLMEFIESLPDKWETVIGANGVGISGGQKQRILIARALYKDPEILFFDEATSALDAENEEVITRNIKRCFPNRTKIIIAHRFSTIKEADHIIVLDRGRIAESGSHATLIDLKGRYYTLFSNQLNLRMREDYASLL